MSSGFPVAADGDIEDGEALLVEGDDIEFGEDIAVFYDGGEYFALNDKCTHGDASLADGWVEDGEVECPMHSGKFCLKSGKVLSMPATVPAPAHKVEVVDGKVVLYPGVEPESDE